MRSAWLKQSVEPHIKGRKMDFQTWSTFVDHFIAAMMSSVKIDAYYSYKIEPTLETSEHHYQNISAEAVKHYLQEKQRYDPLFFKNHEDDPEEMLLLSKQVIPDEYQDFMIEQQIGDNLELYFKYKQVPIRGISLVRSAENGQFVDEDLAHLKNFYHLADFYINQHQTVQAQLQVKQLEAYALTKKEQQVIDLVCQGMDNPHIAAHLYISMSTVKTHIQHIFQKLQVQNKHQLLSKLMLLNYV